MKHKKILSLLSCSIFLMNFVGSGNVKCAAAQTKDNSQAINYIKNHAVTINSLTSDNFKDLEPLKNVLKNKQVVYLGESFHCVGDYNSSKVRLIKYLHEKLGFNVLAFESDLGTCSTVSETTQKLTPTEAMVNSILGVWNTKEMLPLFQYMKKEGNKKDKLNLTGFDMQPNCLIGDFFTVYTYKMLSKIDTSKAKNFYKFDIDYLKNMMALGNKYGGLSVPDKEISKIEKPINSGYKDYSNFVALNRKNLEKFYSDKMIDVCIRELNQRNTFMYMINQKTDEASYEYRDKIMASNLEWIIKTLYPNQKVIVWAHNEHIAKAGSKTFSVAGKTPQKQFEDMGEMVRNDLKDLKDKSYYIGFYLNQGTAADIAGFAPYKVGPMPNGTLENLFVQSGLNNAFIDMSCEKKQTPQNSWMFNKTLVSEDGMISSRIIPASISLVPNEQYDGIVFINKVNSPDYTNIDFKGFRYFIQNPDSYF